MDYRKPLIILVSWQWLYVLAKKAQGPKFNPQHCSLKKKKTKKKRNKYKSFGQQQKTPPRKTVYTFIGSAVGRKL
jgi:hypothetical protein